MIFLTRNSVDPRKGHDLVVKPVRRGRIWKKPLHKHSPNLEAERSSSLYSYKKHLRTCNESTSKKFTTTSSHCSDTGPNAADEIELEMHS